MIKIPNPNSQIPIILYILILIYWTPIMAQESKPLKQPQFQTEFSKTAIWVGDELEYEVTVNYESDIELVTDNLKKDAVNLEPFEILDIKINTRKLVDKKKVTTITFLLTCYETAKSELTIPSLHIYYFHPGSVLQGEKSSAEYFTVPDIKIGLGSTLTGDSMNIREFKPILELSLIDHLIPLPGIIGILFLIILLAMWTVMRIRARLPEQRRINRRFLERTIVSPLDEIMSTKLQMPEEIMQGYTRLSQILGEFIKYWSGIDMSGLTPEEVKAELINCSKNGKQAEKIEEILQLCQSIRYTPAAHLCGKEVINEVLGQARQVILEAIESFG